MTLPTARSSGKAHLSHIPSQTSHCATERVSWLPFLWQWPSSNCTERRGVFPKRNRVGSNSSPPLSAPFSESCHSWRFNLQKRRPERNRIWTFQSRQEGASGGYKWYSECRSDFWPLYGKSVTKLSWNRRAGNDQKLVGPGTEPGICLLQHLDFTQRGVGSSLWEIWQMKNVYMTNESIYPVVD